MITITKMKILFTTLILSVAMFGNSQIVTTVTSLPDVGDVLEYNTLDIITQEYTLSGEDVTWDFTGMHGVDANNELYLDASEGEDFDSFPDADLIIDFAGAAAYANRNTTNIEVVGVGSGGLIPELEGVSAQSLSSPFVTRRAPVGFGDSFSGETAINFTIPLEEEDPLTTFINGLNPFPDSTIDSLKAVFNIIRTEEVDSWGTCVFQSGEEPALRLVQTDEIIIGIELYVNTQLLDTWVDISDFVDPETLGFGSTTTVNYIFLGETSKEHLLEVNVDQTTMEETGRYSTDYYVGIEDLNGSDISIYPNPTSDYLYLEGEDVIDIQIVDFTGKLVLESEESQLDLSSLENGIYYLIGTTRKGEVFTERIFKK